jgi:hypothetical protein
MDVIPGAEHAPILTRVLVELGSEESGFQIEREIRWRADVTDPNDQRAIWRLAALKLGADSDEAGTAIIITASSEMRDGWNLCWGFYGGPGGLRWSDSYLLFESPGDDLAHATGALCAEVWGK